MFLLPTLFMIYFTGICDGAVCSPGVCEDSPFFVCGEGHRLVHGPRAKVYTCQSDDECHVDVNIDISADHFLHCLNSSLCIVDFDRIKNYISTVISLRNSSCSIRQVNIIGLILLDCSCLPDQGASFFDINNVNVSTPFNQDVNSEFLFGYKFGSKPFYALTSNKSGTEYICNVTASSGSFSKVAVVNSFVGKEEVKVKNKEVDCVSLSRNTFYSHREINSTNGALTLEIPLRNFWQDTKAFQLLLWIKVTRSTTVSMACDWKGKESERDKRSACTRLTAGPSSLLNNNPTSETNPGYPINLVVISVVAGVVLIVAVTISIASAVVYTRRYKRKLEEPQYDTMGSQASSSHYTIPNLFEGVQETLPRPTPTTAYVNSAQGNQISRTKDELSRMPITPILPPRSGQIKKSPAIATLSANSAGYSHAFDHLPGNLQGPYQRPNPDDSDSSSKPNYLSFSDIKE